MIMSTEEAGNGDLRPIQLHPNLVPLSSVCTSHGDPELTKTKVAADVKLG